MTTQQHVLACIDGSAVTESVCDYAAWYARRLEISVGLLHVSDVAASIRRDLSGAIGINSRQYLLDELSQLDEQRAKIVNSYSNAIVMGRRGEDHKHSRINIGSQIETVARASSIPVLICSEKFKEPHSYMVAFDASKTANNAITMLAKSNLLKGMQGHIVMIGNDNESAKKSLADARAQMTAAGFLVETHHLPQLDAVNGLLTFQMEHEIDIIVVGAYGSSKLQHLFLGSTTTEIVASTLSPVILVR